MILKLNYVPCRDSHDRLRTRYSPSTNSSNRSHLSAEIMEMEELKRSLPVTVGKVNAIVAKRDEWTETELNERKVAFGPVSFSYRDIISFSEVHI